MYLRAYKTAQRRIKKYTQANMESDKQNRTEQNRTEQNRTEHNIPVWYCGSYLMQQMTQGRVLPVAHVRAPDVTGTSRLHCHVLAAATRC
jgi:hypothetical protein